MRTVTFIYAMSFLPIFKPSVVSCLFFLGGEQSVWIKED